MRTLIGIAVVIGIFLTASVAVANVYRCTPVNHYDCELKNCSRWQPMIQPLSMEYYYLLNSETGEMSYDKNFKDKRTGEMGFSFDRFDWPHGNTDSGVPHGSVFSIE